MKKIAFAALLFGGALSAQAAITLPAIISDNMVLEQNTEVRLWGKGNPGEKVTVTSSWNDASVTAVTGQDGRWSLYFPTSQASSKENTLTFKGDNNTVLVSNILLGEVWLCTGQSNMQYPVGEHKDKFRWMTGMYDSEEVLKEAYNPEIRLFKVPYNLQPTTVFDDCEGSWVIATPRTVTEFSAIGYLFGKQLNQELKLPVGLILAAKGDTHVESWLRKEVMTNNPFYNDVYAEFGVHNKKNNRPHKIPSGLWNGMIHPILGYTVKGNIFYQGCANDQRFEKYQQAFTDLIYDWRKQWNQLDMPFYFVQIAPYRTMSPGIREQQLKTLKSGLKNLDMVVTTDVGDSLDIHPRNKKVPAERLARIALAKLYGKDITYSGPIYRDAEFKGKKVTINFDHTEGGLKTSDGEPLKGFFIAGENQKFYPAKAEIVGNTVVVSSPEVRKPVAVRYGFDYFFRVNLANGDGLPASPFRTDSWKITKDR